MTAPKHTPEPWKILANTEPGAGFAFTILHPRELQIFAHDQIFADDHICMVWANKHAAANAALISLSPRMARFVKDYFDALERVGLTKAKLGDPLSPDYSALREAEEILAELEKAGAL